MKKNIFTTLIVFVFSAWCNAQTVPFQIAIEPLNINGLGGVQAFSFGQHNGKWLIIGGRLDGLHRREAGTSFDIAGHNNLIFVIDPVTKQKWSAPLSSLPIAMQEQLSSTNMEFHQENDYLYLIGGYGYSVTAANHITYPKLAAIKVPDVINAVINGTSFNSYFRQISDEQFAVTGGYLNKIYDTYYLTGGQRFDGRYNTASTQTFKQTYTNSIRKFVINDDGTNLSVTHLQTITDAANLHRRDYNVVQQIMPNGQEGLTAFSGVFQVNANLPFLNCVNIDSTGHTVNNAFSQFYNHYHCAHFPLYSSSNKEMHTVFFGGISQYYDNAGILVKDDNAPFVKTIARVTRDASGTMNEYKLPIEMPALLGASSEFIPLENLPRFHNGVFKLDDFTSDTTLVGYIYGGISSTAPNIFFINNGTQSSASSTIFKVKVIKNKITDINKPDGLSSETPSNHFLSHNYPNPFNPSTTIRFRLPNSSIVKVQIFNTLGQNVTTLLNEQKDAGYYEITWNAVDHSSGVYFYRIEAINSNNQNDRFVQVQKMLLLK